MDRIVEVLSKVMLSLKDDQNEAMGDINALLNKRDTEEGLINNLKIKIRKLSLIHADMQETQSFISQLLKDEEDSSKKHSPDNKKDNLEE